MSLVQKYSTAVSAAALVAVVSSPVLASSPKGPVDDPVVLSPEPSTLVCAEGQESKTFFYDADKLRRSKGLVKIDGGEHNTHAYTSRDLIAFGVTGDGGTAAIDPNETVTIKTGANEIVKIGLAQKFSAASITGLQEGATGQNFSNQTSEVVGLTSGSITLSASGNNPVGVEYLERIFCQTKHKGEGEAASPAGNENDGGGGGGVGGGENDGFGGGGSVELQQLLESDTQIAVLDNKDGSQQIFALPAPGPA